MLSQQLCSESIRNLEYWIPIQTNFVNRIFLDKNLNNFFSPDYYFGSATTLIFVADTNEPANQYVSNAMKQDS